MDELFITKSYEMKTRAKIVNGKMVKGKIQSLDEMHEKQLLLVIAEQSGRTAHEVRVISGIAIFFLITTILSLAVVIVSILPK